MSDPQIPFGLDEPVVEPCADATTPDGTTSIDVLALATGPASITIDGVTVAERSIADVIAADRHAAANRPGLGVKFMRVNPGSAVRE